MNELLEPRGYLAVLILNRERLDIARQLQSRIP
jgi:hypothetical protein